MNLQVGMVSSSPGWEQLLAQEGVPHGIVNLSSSSLLQECAVLCVSRALTGTEHDAVESYLHAGGAVIGSAHHLLKGGDTYRETIEYLVGEGGGLFRDVHLLDIGRDGNIPREANTLRTQANLHGVVAGAFRGGFAVVFPFDVDEMMMDDREATKNFHFGMERLPSERVSVAGKGELRHLVRRSLEYLYAQRGLFYVHTWYFPAGRRNMFAFRIDTDGGSRTDVDMLYDIGRSYDMTMSWYLDVASHESWLGHFSFLVDQEIGVHCYDHHPHAGYEASSKDIARAQHLMEGAGLAPAGYTAPYGMWNHELARAVDDAGFEYSSEFGYAYDTLPLTPVSYGSSYKTLQVPIHPICVGSMMKIGYSDQRMIEYFESVIRQKLLRNEPLFFYHHPTHRRNQVIESLFDQIRTSGIDDTSFLEYARWWKKRAGNPMHVIMDGQTLTIDGLAGDDVWLRMVRPNGDYVIVAPLAQFDTKAFSGWKKEEVAGTPSDLRRIRDFDPRRMLGTLFTSWVGRFK